MTILRPFAFAVSVVLVAAAPVWGQPGRLSESLRKHVEAKSSGTVDVIVHGSTSDIKAIAARHGVSIVKWLSEDAVLRANAEQIASLGAEVDHLSRDVEVRSFMSVTNQAVGADQVWAGIGGHPAFTGAGVGIALIDSGIWTGHRSLAGRVVFAKDFVGEQTSGNALGQASAVAQEDAFGHGTHIAGIIAGSSPYPQDATSQIPFRGVASGANLISLRVIGADGTGRASDVIEAIYWAIQNRKRFNIRVINLSLGGPVEQSYRDDPMCEAVERAVNAGIVVVTAAGNRGKDAEGRSVYGLIESPGNSPYAITVGALNTKGTPARSDDELTTYSSKGPTMIDGVIKPDLAAPGNKIVSAEGAGRVDRGRLSGAARRGRGRRRLHGVERHEHGGRRGERRGGVDARGERQADPCAGEAGAAILGELHARGRPGGRGGWKSERGRSR
jgi:serine protease AprX